MRVKCDGPCGPESRPCWELAAWTLGPRALVGGGTALPAQRRRTSFPGKSGSQSPRARSPPRAQLPHGSAGWCRRRSRASGTLCFPYLSSRPLCICGGRPSPLMGAHCKCTLRNGAGAEPSGSCSLGIPSKACGGTRDPWRRVSQGHCATGSVRGWQPPCCSKSDVRPPLLQMGSLKASGRVCWAATWSVYVEQYQRFPPTHHPVPREPWRECGWPP